MDAYVACLEPNGALRWLKTVGEINQAVDDYASDVAVYGGSIYITGYTNGFRGTNPDLSPFDKIFVARLSASDGGLRWLKVIGSYIVWMNTLYLYYYATGIAVDGDSVYVTGYLKAGYLTHGPIYDVFVASLSISDGSLQWFKIVRGDDPAVANDIAVYGGSMYITGYVSFLTETDAFVASFSASNGTLQWFKTVEGANDAKSIIVSENRIYVAGETDSFGAGGMDAYAACLELNGSLRWFKAIGGADNDKANSIALHENHTYLAGETNIIGTEGDTFVASLSASDGSLEWFRTIEKGSAQDIAVDANVTYIAGESINFNGTYVAKLTLDYLSSDNPESLKWTANEKWPPVSVNAANPFVTAQTPLMDSQNQTVGTLSPAVGTGTSLAGVAEIYPETHIADMAVSDVAQPSFPWGWVISGVAAAAIIVVVSILVIRRRRTPIGERGTPYLAMQHHSGFLKSSCLRTRKIWHDWNFTESTSVSGEAP
jgi:hypothetical protein